MHAALLICLALHCMLLCVNRIDEVNCDVFGDVTPSLKSKMAAGCHLELGRGLVVYIYFHVYEKRSGAARFTQICLPFTRVLSHIGLSTCLHFTLSYFYLY